MLAVTARFRRRGTVLVWFALVVFAILGLAALVVDLGLVRVEQQRMRSQVESAALEGLRFRDDITPLGGDANATPAARDAARRQAAAARGTPALQTNTEANEPHGDLVAGTFQHGRPATERADYTRADFDADPAGLAFLARQRRTDKPSPLDDEAGVSSHQPGMPLRFGQASVLGAGSSLRQHGFTVRATAIASARPALAVGPAYPDGLYPGRAPVFVGMPGAAPFALDVAYWNALGTEPPREVKADGTITGAGRLVGITSLADPVAKSDGTLVVTTNLGLPPPFLVRIDRELLRVVAVTGTTWTVQRAQQGTVANPDNQDYSAQTPVALHAGWSLGQETTPLNSPLPDGFEGFTGNTFATLVPLVEGGRVCGFGRVQWSVIPPNAGTGYQLQLTRQPSTVLPWNASAVPTQPISGLTAGQLNALMKRLQERDVTKPENERVLEPVLVPALVR